MQDMVNTVDTLRQRHQQVLDSEKEARVEREEERSRGLMLEEQVSALTLELTQSRASKDKSDRAAEARADTLRAEREAAEKLRTEIEVQMKRV